MRESADGAVSGANHTVHRGCAAVHVERLALARNTTERLAGGVATELALVMLWDEDKAAVTNRI